MESFFSAFTKPAKPKETSALLETSGSRARSELAAENSKAPERLLAKLPQWAKWTCGVLWVTSLGLNIFSVLPSTAFITLSAAPEPLAQVLCMPPATSPCAFSITHSVSLLLQVNMYLFAVVLIGFSLCFPPFKLLCLLYLTVVPTSRGFRCKAIEWLGKAGRVSLLDIFFMLVFMIAFCDQGHTISVTPPWADEPVFTDFFGVGTSVAAGTFTFAFAIICSISAVGIAEVFVVYGEGDDEDKRAARAAATEREREAARDVQAKAALAVAYANADMDEAAQAEAVEAARQYQLARQRSTNLARNNDAAVAATRASRLVLEPGPRQRWAVAAAVFALAGIPLVSCSVFTTFFTIDGFGSVINDEIRSSMTNVSLPSHDPLPQELKRELVDKFNTTVEPWLAEHISITVCQSGLSAKRAMTQIGQAAASLLDGNGLNPPPSKWKCLPTFDQLPRQLQTLIASKLREAAEAALAKGREVLDRAVILISQKLRDFHVLRPNAWSLLSGLSALTEGYDGSPQPQMLVFMLFLMIFLLGTPCLLFGSLLWLLLAPLAEASRLFWLRTARFLSTLCFLEVLWLGVLLYMVQMSHLIALKMGPGFWCTTAYVVCHFVALRCSGYAFERES